MGGVGARMGQGPRENEDGSQETAGIIRVVLHFRRCLRVVLVLAGPGV